MNLKPLEIAYWQADVNSTDNAEKLGQAFLSAGYAENPQITDELLVLYLNGKKTSGSSVVEGVHSADDPLPQGGGES
jgi:uncharacterized protein YhfF